MNILIPYSWLKEYLETKASPEKIAKCLTLCSASVEKIIKVKDDSIFEIEITSNRPDMMSILGIARELAAILPQFGIKAKLKKNPYLAKSKFKVQGLKFKNKLHISIKDSKLCPRFTAVVMDNIIIKPSPKFIQDRLIRSGLRPINNIVDITNYLMKELGQPFHAFDFEEVKKQTMILRASIPGEKITTLDGQKYILPGNDIIIEDGDKRIIDLCGIMGGANSHITQKTKKIIFFVQNYNPINIRRTAMKIGKRTEAGSLFEKSPDPEIILQACWQGIELIKKYANANISSKIYDLYPNPHKPKTIKLSLQLIELYLGIKLQPNKVIKILNSLGFKSLITNHQSLITTAVPSWRSHDINIPEDLIEEIARVYGFHHLPSTLMASALPTNYPTEHFNLESKVKTYLCGMGIYEIYTNSLISEKLAKASFFALHDHLKIKNALSKEWIYLRRSLIPSHLQAIADNPKAKTVSFFEIAKVYLPQKNNLPNEQLQLVISTTKEYLKLKGIVELLLEKLYLPPDFNLGAKGISLLWDRHESANIIINNEKVGFIGSINLPKDYPYEKVHLAKINFDKLAKYAQNFPKYHPISGYPPIIEDLTFTTTPQVLYIDLFKMIALVDPLIKKVSLVSLFKNNLTFQITYQDFRKNLTSKLVGNVREKIVKKVREKGWGSLKEKATG